MADLYYIEEDYYNPSLGYFVYTADAAAAIASSATMSVSGDKVVEAAATMSATFTQSASITHIEGVDLFAFTNAALAAQVSRIRDSNISVSAVFSAAIDVSRIQQVNADQSAQFSFTTTVVRSRDFASQQSAAFSLAATNDRLRAGSSDVSAAFALSAVITHIESVNLTAFVNASLSVSAISTRSAGASLASQFTLTGGLGGPARASAALVARSTLTTSRYFGTGRPWNVTGYTGLPITSIDNNWSAVPYPNEEWMIEFLVNGNISDQQTVFTLGPLTLSRLSNRYRLSIVDSTGTTKITNINTSFTQTGSSPRITIIKESGGNSRCAIYINGDIVSGSNTNGFNITWQTLATFKLNFPTASGITSISNFNFRIGNRYSYTNASSTVPAYETPTNDPLYTQLLLNDYSSGTGFDDTRVTEIASASLTSTASITAILSGPVRISANLTASTTLSATVGKLNEIVLTAFTNASLTTQISKLTGFASSQSAAFSVSAVNARTRDAVSTQSSEFTQVTEILRQRNIDINVSSQFGLVVTAVKQTNNAASFSSAHQFASTAVKTVNVQLPLLSLFTPSIVVIAAKNAEIILQAATTLTANNLRTRESAVDLAGQFNQTVVSSKIINATVTLNTAFNISATSVGIIEVTVFVNSQFTQQTTALRTRFTQLTVSSNFGIVIDTFDSLAKTASANLVAATNMIVVNARTRLGTVNISGVFSKLAVSVITTNSVLNVVMNASMTTTVKKFSDVGVNLNVNSVMSITSSRILASAQLTVPVTANITIDGTINILAQANLSALTVMSVIGTRTRDIDLIVNNFAVLNTNISRTRTSTAVYSVVATMSVTTTKLITTSATLVSTASFTAASTRQRNAIANLATSGAVLVVGKVIKVDTYVYEIPAETRIHIINSETRKYTIRSETRKYTIRRA